MPHRALCEHPFRVARLVIIRPALLCRAAMSKFARAALAIRKQFSRRLADNALLPSCILSPRAMPHSALCADHAACDDAACTAGPRHSVKRCSRRVSPCLVSRFSAGNASLPRCPPSPNRFLQRRGVLPFPTLPSARRVLCLMKLFMCSFCLSFLGGKMGLACSVLYFTWLKPDSQSPLRAATEQRKADPIHDHLVLCVGKVTGHTRMTRCGRCGRACSSAA